MAIAGPVIRIWIRRVSPRRHYHPIHRGSRLWSRIMICPRGFLPGGGKWTRRGMGQPEVSWNVEPYPPTSPTPNFPYPPTARWVPAP